MTDIDKVVSGYLQAVEFTDCGPDAEPEIGDASFGPEIEAYALRVCKAFMGRLEQDLQGVELAPATDYERLGMCVWYSQQGHGCGFGDYSFEFTTREGQDLGALLASIVDKLGISPANVWAESGTMFAE
jgi:hypothetical protein